jgi:hypothetical protein
MKEVKAHPNYGKKGFKLKSHLTKAIDEEAKNAGFVPYVSPEMPANMIEQLAHIV